MKSYLPHLEHSILAFVFELSKMVQYRSTRASGAVFTAEPDLLSVHPKIPTLHEVTPVTGITHHTGGHKRKPEANLPDSAKRDSLPPELEVQGALRRWFSERL